MMMEGRLEVEILDLCEFVELAFLVGYSKG